MVTIGDGANDVFLTKVVDTGTGTGTIGMDAIKNAVDTASVDDNPVMTAGVAEEGCRTHDNTWKVT